MTLAKFLSLKLPEWLNLSSEAQIEIERAHRSFAPSPRSVLVRFLRYTDRESVFQAALRKRDVFYKNNRLRFYQDLRDLEYNRMEQ
ncbi:hypothetical protein MHYP_G00335210 [Metynnis hypsauchen]